jgi:hypothetical protein
MDPFSDKLAPLVQGYVSAKDLNERRAVCARILQLSKIEAIAVCLEVTFRDGWGLLRAKRKAEQGFHVDLFDDLLSMLESVDPNSETQDAFLNARDGDL